MSCADEAGDRDVSRGTAGLLAVAGLALAGSTLVPWTGSPGVEPSLWQTSSAVDVSVAALGSVAAVAALVARMRGGWRAFLVAVASAAALTAGCWAGEYVTAPGAGPLTYPGPAIALGCASILLAGAATCARGAVRVSPGRGREVALGRAALLVAGAASPALAIATGVGGVSLYERTSVLDVGLVVLAVLVLVSALLSTGRPLMTWVAIAAGAGLAGLAYATGIEMLLAEQSVLDDTDGTGLALAFVAAPLAAAGTVLLAAATDDAAATR